MDAGWRAEPCPLRLNNLLTCHPAQLMHQVTCHVSRVTVVRQSTRSRVTCRRGSRVTCHLGEVVDPCELQQRGHAVEEAAHDEPVQRSGVVHLQYSTVQYSAVQYNIYCTLGRPVLLSRAMVDRVSTAVMPECSVVLRPDQRWR